jgi:succinate dehydrogenase / fumarate reductase cytochrome b subunit
MSSAAPTKREFSTNTLRSRRGLIDWLKPFFTTSVGMKATTGLTGFLLTGFVIVHLVGNLQVFAGQDAINGYAAFLKSLGPGLWIARGGLLAIFILHLYLTLTLNLRARRARPVPYRYHQSIQASTSSRTMVWTGLATFVFILFHLAHYTFGLVGTTYALNPDKGYVQTNYLSLVDPLGRHDVYSMTVAGFRDPVISILYLLAQVILFLHLSHGIGSMFQSLGLNSPRIQPCLSALARVLAFLILAGNVAIVVAIWLGRIPEVQKLTH